MAAKGWVRIAGGVPCPKCQGDSKVLDTYWASTFNQLCRRRQCKSCNHQFRTGETVIEKHATIRGKPT